MDTARSLVVFLCVASASFAFSTGLGFGGKFGSPFKFLRPRLPLLRPVPAPVIIQPRPIISQPRPIISPPAVLPAPRPISRPGRNIVINRPISTASGNTFISRPISRATSNVVVTNRFGGRDRVLVVDAAGNVLNGRRRVGGGQVLGGGGLVGGALASAGVVALSGGVGGVGGGFGVGGVGGVGLGGVGGGVGGVGGVPTVLVSNPSTVIGGGLSVGGGVGGAQVLPAVSQVVVPQQGMALGVADADLMALSNGQVVVKVSNDRPDLNIVRRVVNPGGGGGSSHTFVVKSGDSHDSS